MTFSRSTRYTTQGGITVYRASVKADYDKSTNDILAKLDSQQGALYTSSFEFPGRYTRWDVGFVNPPLKIVGQGRRLVFSALNRRGEVMLALIQPVIERCEAVATTRIAKTFVEAELKPPRKIVFEEERSRQYTVFSVLRDVIALLHSTDDNTLGLYGAFGYELTFQFEAIREKLERNPEERDLVLYLPDEILVVDHQKETAMCHSYDFEGGGMATRLMPRDGTSTPFKLPRADQQLQDCDHVPGEYAATVRKALEYFKRGDLFETVPGQMFREKCIDAPSAIFKRLKENNPSPYGAFINLGEGEYLVAASPEMFVRVEHSGQELRVETCPISGTISRGVDAIEDAEKVLQLLNSGKDKAELSMCTDVDRNDKSRICKPGSVKVIGRRQTEMYSRLIHTVDHVEGLLRPEFDALDAFLSHTWAVTVTGAPKHAAIQFIEDHEKSPRRWYGGALGFLKFNGEINTGLTLRTIRVQDGIAEIRAGATLLFDSDPVEEEKETRLKASALIAAIRNEYRAVSTGHGATGGKPGEGLQVLMVDHNDSFVHTLSSYFQETGASVITVRPKNLEKALTEVTIDLVVLSPGPGRPKDFDVSQTLSCCLERKLPVFGVCLGLQGIVEYFGGSLKTLALPVHGKSSELTHMSGYFFSESQVPLTVGRYHSLVADKVPSCLKVTASTGDVVMAIEHETLPVSAVQFHPESILSLHGDGGANLIRNVVEQVTMNEEAKEIKDQRSKRVG